MPEARRAPLLIISASGYYLLLIHRSGLLRSFQAAGYDLLVTAPPGRGKNELEAIGIRTRDAPLQATGTNPFSDFRLYRFFVHLFRRERPAAFIGFTVKPNVFGSAAARRYGVPSINNISGLGRVFNRRTLLTGLVERLYRWGLSRACVVFFENRDDEHHFLERGIVTRGQAVPLAGAGLDLRQFAPAPRKRKPDEPFTFLLAARLLWAKGVLHFVEAARILRAERDDVCFRILGFVEPSGPDSVPQADLDRWVAEGIIDYAGGTQQVPPFIAACDAVVLPTYYREGVPRILMEAAAMERPAIATLMPGCRDVIDDGVTGFLCEPRSGEALAAAMRRVLALSPGDRTAMGKAARAKMEREYDEKFVIAAYDAALGRCIAVPALG